MRRSFQPRELPPPEPVILGASSSARPAVSIINAPRSRVPISIFKKPELASKWADNLQRQQLSAQSIIDEQNRKQAKRNALLDLSSGADTNDTLSVKTGNTTHAPMPSIPATYSYEVKPKQQLTRGDSSKNNNQRVVLNAQGSFKINERILSANTTTNHTKKTSKDYLNFS